MTEQRELAQECFRWLTEQQSAMVSLLTDFARIESPSFSLPGIAAAQRFLTETFEGLGFFVKHLPGPKTGGSLLAYPRDRSRKAPLQILLGHCDTVWPTGTLHRMPVDLREGKLYGPGVFDMKGGLVQAIFAVKALQAIGTKPSVVPMFFVNADEEVGSPESTAHLRKLARIADRVWVMEPALGERGLLKTARKGIGQFQIQVEGRAAHSGLDPGKGISAIEELSYVIQRLCALNQAYQGVTVNVGVISGGVRPNVVAAKASAEVDVRITSQVVALQVMEAIHSLRPTIAGTRLSVTGGIVRPPLEPTPRNRKLWEAAVESAGWLGIEIGECSVGGASDGNTTSPLTATLDGLGSVGDGAHAEHEHISVTEMPRRAALLASLLMREGCNR